jgi:hypothetical protein
MSRGVALGLAAFLFLGWLANLAVSTNRGGIRELYPLTAFPMFAGSSGAPSRAVVEYVFLVEARPDGKDLGRADPRDALRPRATDPT